MACDPNELLAASSDFSGLTAAQHDAVQTELLCRIYEGGGGGGVDATALHKADNLSDVASVPISRTNLGIGTGDSPTFTGLTLSGLTPGSVLFAGAAGAVSQDNANFFFNDAANALLVAGSVSTPSLISTGALTITPAAGSNLNVTLATTGDFAVNTNQLYVDSSATNVGINTTTPTAKLFILGTNSGGPGSSAQFAIGGSTSISTGNMMQMGYNTTSDYGWIQPVDWDVGYKDLVLNQNGGNVGIGTTGPQTKLHVADNGGVDVSATTANFTIESSTAAKSAIRFLLANQNEYMMGIDTAISTGKFRIVNTAGGLTLTTSTKGIVIDSDGAVNAAVALRVGGSAAINTISKVLQGSATLNPGSVAAGANATSTITVTGAAVSDPVILGLPDSWGSSNMFFTAWVSAANTVSIKYHNVNAVSAIDLASELVKVFVIQQ